MKKKFFKTAVLTSLFLIPFSLPLVANGIGVSVKPASEEVKALVGQDNWVRFEIENPSNEVALFEIYPDEFDPFIKPFPSKLTLESGEKREIKIKVSPPKEGRFETTLSVSARPLGDASFNVGSGVKIPFSIIATEKPNQLGLISAFRDYWMMLLAVLVLVVAVIRYSVSYLRRSDKKGQA